MKKKLVLLGLFSLLPIANAEPIYRYYYPLNVNMSSDIKQPTNPGDGATDPGDESETPDPTEPTNPGEGEWVASEPKFTEWVTSAVDSCQTWSPSPTTYQGAEIPGDTEFTQTGNNCEATSERLRQDREVNTVTNDYRDAGPAVNESKTVAVETGTRQYIQKFGDWYSTNGADALYNCETFTPEANTVRAGDEFQQAVTNCTESMSRAGMGYYWDRKSGWQNDPDNPYQYFSTEVYGVDRTIRAWGTRPWGEGDY